MAGQKRKFDSLTLAILALAVLIVAYLGYSFWFGGNGAAPAYDSGLGRLKSVNGGTLGALKNLSACGDWPLAAVNLSVDRGNPFSRRRSALPAMSATSSVLCLPVTQ